MGAKPIARSKFIITLDMESPEKKFTPKENRIDDLKNFLISPNPKYDHLVNAVNIKQEKNEQDFIPDSILSEPYSDNWIRLLNDFKFEGTPEWKEKMEREREEFLKRLRGKILVDLGAGSYQMKGFAKEMGVSVYIAVDPHLHGHSDKPIDPMTDLSNSEESDENMQVIKIKADALDFVRRLPADSVNFTINGLDIIVLNKFLPPQYFREYPEALEEEVIRATEKEGIIFGFGTEIIDENSRQPYLIKRKGIRELELVGLKDKAFIKEK